MDPFTIALIIGALTTSSSIGFSMFGSNQAENSNAKQAQKIAIANAQASATTDSLLRDVVVAAAVAAGVYVALHLALEA